MTHKKIDAMRCGAEIDARIEGCVFGHVTHRCIDGSYRSNSGLARCKRNVPNYSTDIRDAWKLIEKMRADGWFFQLGDVWPAAWQRGARSEWRVARFSNGDKTVESMAQNDALAICRAALKAVAAASTA